MVYIVNVMNLQLRVNKNDLFVDLKRAIKIRFGYFNWMMFSFPTVLCASRF